MHVFIFERCLNNLDPCGVFQMPCVFVILNYAWVSVRLFQFWFSKSVHKRRLDSIIRMTDDR